MTCIHNHYVIFLIVRVYILLCFIAAKERTSNSEL